MSLKFNSLVKGLIITRYTNYCHGLFAGFLSEAKEVCHKYTYYFDTVCFCCYVLKFDFFSHVYINCETGTNNLSCHFTIHTMIHPPTGHPLFTQALSHSTSFTPLHSLHTLNQSINQSFGNIQHAHAQIQIFFSGGSHRKLTCLIK